MLDPVSTKPKQLQDYSQIAGEELLNEIRNLAAPLKDARILNINATAFGGGVAEILMSLVPLMQDIGLDATWQVIQGNDDFFNVTKASHNGLQGMQLPLTDSMKNTWKKYNQLNANRFEGEYDFIIVHDPQPAGLKFFLEDKGAQHWIWRCHIDTSHPNPDFWNFYAPYINTYENAIFTLKDYVGPGVAFKNLAIIPPTIDPLSEKNAPIPVETARATIASYGIDPDRPLVTQVSRFDPWKDPLGVIDAYRIVKLSIPDVQLALVGSMASDDPEGWYYLDKTTRHAGEDNDIHILHNFHGVGGYEVGCFQTASDVVIQKSTREGFGLVVTEALWKGVPVVGGNVGGIPLQILDGKTGYLVDTVEQCADRVQQLLKNPGLCTELGTAAREFVRTHFLTMHHLRNYLKLFQTIAGK
ncbi:MAG: glycosyltransferase [Anaerolineales bacterium]|nr:glycosyltransferase [Anaerolineales bacterium]